MERSVLERSVAAAQEHLKTVRLQLLAVAREKNALEDSLRQGQELQNIDDRPRPKAVEDLEKEAGESKVRAHSGSVLEVEKSNAYAEKLAAVQNVLVESLGMDADKQRLSVSKVLKSITMNKPRNKMVLLETEDARFFKLTVFAGKEATVSCTLNVNLETSFAEALVYTCEYFEIDPMDFTLQANISSNATDLHYLSFGDDDNVVKCLRDLKLDSSKGFGCCGMVDSNFVKRPTFLPPVYLLKKTIAREMDPERDRSLAVPEEEVFNGIKINTLRRIFNENCRVDGNMATAEKLITVMHEYFEGHYIDRGLLTSLFEEQSFLIEESSTQYSERVDLEGTIRIAEAVQKVFGKRSRVRGFTDTVSPETVETTFDSSPPVSASAVFRWIIDVGKTSISNDERPFLEENVNFGNESTNEIKFEHFHKAITSALPVDVQKTESWWTSFFGPLQLAITKESFERGWESLAKVSLAPVYGNSSLPNESSTNETIQDVIKRSIYRDKTKKASMDKHTSQLLRVHSRRSAAIDAVFAIIALILAYLSLFSYNRPSTISTVSKTFQTLLAESEIYCLNISNVIETGVLAPQFEDAKEFTDISSLGCIWGFIMGPLFQLYYHDFVAGNNISATDFFTILSSYRLTPETASVRLLRANGTECRSSIVDNSNAISSTDTCFSYYDESTASKSPIEPFPNATLVGGMSFSNYSSSFKWNEFPFLDPVVGKFGEYDGSGYMYNFGKVSKKDSDADSTMLASMNTWMNDIINLIRLGWIDVQTRAIIINLGLVSQNIDMYVNVQFVTEVSPSAMVFNSFQIRSFNPDVSSGSGFFVSVFLRVIILILLATNLIIQIKRTLEGEIVGTGQSRKTLRENARVSSENRTDELESYNSSNVTSKTGFVTRVRAGFFKIFTSFSLSFDAVALIWVIICIVAAKRFSDRQDLNNFVQAPFNQPWNAIYITTAYYQVAAFDAFLIVLLSVKFLIVMKLLDSHTAALVDVIRQSIPYLLNTALWLFPLTVGFMVAFQFMVSTINRSADSIHTWFLLEIALLGNGLQTNNLNSTPTTATTVMLYILSVVFNLFVVLLFYGLVFAIYHYFYNHLFIQGVLDDPELQRSSGTTLFLSKLLSGARQTSKSVGERAATSFAVTTGGLRSESFLRWPVTSDKTQSPRSSDTTSEQKPTGLRGLSSDNLFSTRVTTDGRTTISLKEDSFRGIQLYPLKKKGSGSRSPLM